VARDERIFRWQSLAIARYVILVVVWLIHIINYFDRLAVLIFLPFIQRI